MTWFGVGPIDEDLPEDAKHILVSSEAGVEAEAFLHQAASQAELSVYVSLNRAPSRVRRSLQQIGTNKQPIFIDGHTALTGMASEESFSLQDPSNIDELVRKLEDVAKIHPNAVLIFDALSTACDRANLPIQRLIGSLMPALKQFEHSLCLFTEWPYEQPPSDLGRDFDATIRIRQVQGRILAHQVYQVQGQEEKPVRMFEVSHPGGLLVSIPKLLVTGPGNAGKSTFIHAVAADSVSVDRHGTTVALDRGSVTLDGIHAELFGTPGQPRFDPLLRTLSAQSVGIILLVDGSRPDTFDRARDMMELVWRQGIPLLVAVNKQDLDGVLEPAEAMLQIKAPQPWPFMGCVAREKESADSVLRTMFTEILEV